MPPSPYRESATLARKPVGIVDAGDAARYTASGLNEALMRIFIGIIFSFLCIGCFSNSSAGPDSGTMPDDGTVIVGGDDGENEEKT